MSPKEKTNLVRKDKAAVLPCPFPGLRPFRTDEAHLFFGREGQIDEVLEKLERHRFVAILGTSGSGKSSFMFCGLIPSLQGGFMTVTGSNWRILVMRPGTRPIQNLANCLLDKERFAGLPEQDLQIKCEYYHAVLKTSSLGLVELLDKIRQEEDENILLLVDQFEELFRFHRGGDENSHLNETTAFVNMMLNAVKAKNRPFYVVLTMRSDFIGDCAVFPELTSFINDSHYLIPQMNRDQKRLVILGPIAVGGGVISPRLTQQLLNDLGDNPDQLPILQHALMRTWNFWAANRKGDEPIDLFHYEAIGKMEQALSLHADEAYLELDESGRRICEIMFKALTEKGSDGRGVRRPTQVQTIAQIAKVSPEQVIEVVEVFRQTGRTFLMPPPGIQLTPDTYIDISHESLMRIWVRLADWVEEESESVKMYLKLADAAYLYQQRKSGLWRPPDLLLAIAWYEKEQPTLTWAERFDPSFERAITFLFASQRAYEEEQRNRTRQQKAAIRRTRLVAFVLGLAAVVSLIFVIYARLQTQKAENESRIARREKLRADSLLLISNYQRQKAIEAQKKAEDEKARAEIEKARAIEKEQEANRQRELARQQTELARKEALRAENEAKKAKEQQAEAERQREMANRFAKDANAEKINAEMARNDAERLRFLALAQSIAAKSEQIKDTTLQILLARQAFNFNQKYQGPIRQPEVFSGLYSALSRIAPKDFNVIRGHSDKITTLHFVGNDLISVSSDGKILRCNPSTMNCDILFSTGKNPEYLIRSAAVSPDGQKIALGTTDGIIRILNLSTRQIEKSLRASSQAVWALAFHPKQNIIVSCGGDSTQLVMTNLTDGSRKIIAKTQSHIRSFDWVNESEVAGILKNGDIYIWNIHQNTPVEPLVRNKGEYGYETAYEPKSNLLASGFYSGKVVLYNASTGDVDDFMGHGGWISDIKFSPDGTIMATASFDNRVQIWDLKKRNEAPLILRDFKTWVTSVAFSPDNRYIFVGCRDGIIKKFDLYMEDYANKICEFVRRENKPKSMSQKDWNRYIGETIERESTCK